MAAGLAARVADGAAGGGGGDGGSAFAAFLLQPLKVNAPARIAIVHALLAVCVTGILLVEFTSEMAERCALDGRSREGAPKRPPERRGPELQHWIVSWRKGRKSAA